MNKSELHNLDIVKNLDGVWLYVSNKFYPLHHLDHTVERRGRPSIPLAEASKLGTMQDTGNLFLHTEIAIAPTPTTAKSWMKSAYLTDDDLAVLTGYAAKAAW